MSQSHELKNSGLKVTLPRLKILELFQNREPGQRHLSAEDVYRLLLSEDMERLADAHRLSRRTSRVIRQNLTFAIGAMVVLVIGGLFFDLPLPLVVIGHEGGTVLVVLNGLRLLSDPIRRLKASVAGQALTGVAQPT